MRYRLVSDNDGHWYLIPENRDEEWNHFCELSPDDEASWTPPSWANAIDGSPSNVTFSNPSPRY